MGRLHQEHHVCPSECRGGLLRDSQQPGSHIVRQLLQDTSNVLARTDPPAQMNKATCWAGRKRASCSESFTAFLKRAPSSTCTKLLSIISLQGSAGFGQNVCDVTRGSWLYRVVCVVALAVVLCVCGCCCPAASCSALHC